MLRNKPDPILAKDQLQALQSQLKAWGAEHFCATMFWILTKVPNKYTGAEESRLAPFRWNRIQKHFYSRLARNNRMLKARQAGYTTFFLLVRLLLNIITEGGKAGLLVSQNHKYAQEHFMIARRAYRLIGAQDPMDDSKNLLSNSLKANLLHTTYSNRKELVFDMLDSKLLIESAEVEEAAQGITLHHAVGSEVPRWPGNPEETVSNIKAAIAPGGTWDEEGTANGAGGYFHEQYLKSMDDEAKADARAHFHSWFWNDTEYRINLSETEKDELEKDLTDEEYQVIRQMHRELDSIAYV